MLTKNQLSVGLTYNDVEFLSTQNVSSYLSVASEVNQNLTASQKELLLWHWRIGHAGFKWVQWLFAKSKERDNESILSSKNPTVSSCKVPLCVACQVAKQARRGAEAMRHVVDKDKEMLLKRNNLQPGDAVSIDQYVSALPGRLPHTKGKEKAKDRYTGGTIFVDHASTKIFVKHQVSLNAGETVMAKKAFEREAFSNGVIIQQYHADNLPFNAKVFTDDLESKGQTITLSGTGANHQNGLAERAIKTVVSWARALLLHMVIHWPECGDLMLWPFALDYAIYTWNHLPNMRSGLSPEEVFSSSRTGTHTTLQRLKVWGCPVYVLDPALQDGKKLPKWHPRARRGQFLGFSTKHSTTVGLVLNLRTGHVSPQYHVVYDELFSTVTTTAMDMEVLNNNHVFSFDDGNSLILTGYERSTVLEDIITEGGPTPELDAEWLSPAELREREALRQRRQARRRLAGSEDPTVQRNLDNLDPILRTGSGAPTRTERSEIQELVQAQDMPETGGEIVVEAPQEASDEESTQTPDVRSRGSERKRRPRNKNRKYYGNEWVNYQVGVPRMQKIRTSILNEVYLQELKWSNDYSEISSNDLKRFIAAFDYHVDYDNGTVEYLHPLALAARANADDNPTWEIAMNGPDRAGYWKAMEVEYFTLESEMDFWDVIEREEWMNVLPSNWAFRCKQFPDGTVRKLKARFCVRGDKQREGIDFFDTYAPVVNWQTVRLMLILSITLGLATKQLDYTAAFVHAPIDKDPNWDNLSEEERRRSGVYIQMQRGFSEQGKVLKLKKSLYGLKQAPRNFFLHLKAQLEAIGFRSLEEVDPCLFISENVICLVYVDDTLFYSPKEEFIEDAIKRLRERSMDLEVEGEVAGFLGVHIERNDNNGTITLTRLTHLV